MKSVPHVWTKTVGYNNLVMFANDASEKSCNVVNYKVSRYNMLFPLVPEEQLELMKKTGNTRLDKNK